MKIIESISEMREYSQQLKRENKVIASVDTDAELHDGHMTLVKIAKENADVVVLSSGHSVDYKEMTGEEYKKKKFQYRHHINGLSRDIELSKLHGVDVFCYLQENQLYVDDLIIPLEMCENVYNSMKHRETLNTDYFSNMIHTLSTFFPIFKVVTPDITVVGQKDAYQNFGLKSLIKQLNLLIKIITVPILRDSDGLACSSRNTLLTSSERQRALSMYQVLQEIASWEEIEPINYIKSYITHHVKADICMVDVVCAETLKDLTVFDRKMLIIINAFFKDIYLTDNIIIEP